MPLRTRPLGNNCLIEVIKEYDGVSRADENEDKSTGILRDVSVHKYHLTASASIRFDEEDLQIIANDLDDLIGKEVRWEQYAEGGQTFVEAGKTYALIPWWRLISVNE